MMVQPFITVHVEEDFAEKAEFLTDYESGHYKKNGFSLILSGWEGGPRKSYSCEKWRKHLAYLD